jgi:uncharacterized membrane protein YkvA (DUF1232 family)
MSDHTETVTATPEVQEAGTDERGLVRKARRIAARLPFVRHVVAMWYALRDSETPMWARAILAGAVAYFVLPTDLIPDLLAGVGFTDDAAVVMAALKTVSSVLKPQHYEQADERLRRERESR